MIKSKTVKDIYDNYNHYMGQNIRVNGWIRTVRKQKEMYFIEVNDGSCLR
jgi:asparaginyl-tRNA synthetase